VKFALGENPKRSPNRYPNTRMGVQEIIRDHFLAARDYEKEWKTWEKTKTGIPPRKDLRMEALLDILNRKLLVSSHGYRADEFLALVRLTEEFGFKVQTLQHGVEAYKIADELKKSGVAAVVWSDWGAFKMEAYDATSYNARLLMEAGVVTSLHSDDNEISTRMNWEAGKLLRSGVNEIDAMNTVTINAAKAIAIDSRIGSLEAGKDADFVIWNGNPLSQFTKAEQTWVDGRKYFSLDEDKLSREEIAKQRAQLIQAIIAAGPADAAPPVHRRVAARGATEHGHLHDQPGAQHAQRIAHEAPHGRACGRPFFVAGDRRRGRGYAHRVRCVGAGADSHRAAVAAARAQGRHDSHRHEGHHHQRHHRHGSRQDPRDRRPGGRHAAWREGGGLYRQAHLPGTH